MTKLFVTLLAIVSFSVVAEKTPQSLTFGHSLTFYSQILKEERTVYVHLPRSYEQAKDKRYPLYLTFDARSMFHPAASLSTSLSSAEMVPEMVVVSIKNTQRWRDLTPKLPNEEMEVGTGEGSKFFDFIENELMPNLRSTYRINDFKVLSGHSLGGLMVVDAIAQRPTLFDAYVAISPAVSWINQELFDQYKKAFKSNKNPLLYVVNADEQHDLPRLNQLKSVLDSNRSNIINYRFDDLSATENHHSIRTIGELNGMKWIFRHFLMPANKIYSMTDEEITKHYEYVSELYKANMSFDLMKMTNAAYWGLTNEKHQQRAMALFHQAINTWPDNAYAWSCLAEAEERMGNIKQAYQHVNHAVELGKKFKFGDMHYLLSMQARIKASL